MGQVGKIRYAKSVNMKISEKEPEPQMNQDLTSDNESALKKESDDDGLIGDFFDEEDIDPGFVMIEEQSGDEYEECPFEEFDHTVTTESEVEHNIEEKGDEKIANDQVTQ